MDFLYFFEHINSHFFLKFDLNLISLFKKKDGTLKRKFSLPKLSDTLEAVKNCGYLRRHSTGNTSSKLDSDYDVDIKNIFKDIQNVSEYDISSYQE